jgi:hypothetical protein
MHEKRIVRLFRGSALALAATAALVAVAAAITSLPTGILAQFVADKEHSLFRDVQKRRSVCPESSRERNAFAVGANGDFPAEAAGKRNGDVSQVGAYFDVEVRTDAALPVGAMLFCVWGSINALSHFPPPPLVIEKRGKRTTFARTEPDRFKKVKEARFDLPLSSWMIHTSALMCPFNVWKIRLWSWFEIKTPSTADRSSGGMERSRAYFPSMEASVLDTRK